jgi:hypothetical protein
MRRFIPRWLRGRPIARGVLLGCVAGLGGCLYVGGVNHPPEGTVELVNSTVLPVKGATQTLKAIATDPDDDSLQYVWRVQVLAQEDGRTYRLTKAAAPDNYKLASDAGDEAKVATTEIATFQLPLRGTYTATVTISDSLGAQSQASKTFEVKNQAPVVPEIRIDKDDRATSDRVPDLDGSWPLHAHYKAMIPTQDINDKLIAYDPEGDLSCAQSDAVRWDVKIEPQKAGTLAYADVIYCTSPKDDPLFSQLYFRYQPSTPAEPKADLVVTATITDSFGLSTTVSSRRAVVANRRPCIMATLPSTDLPQVIVLHDEGKLFWATEVSEDVNDGLTYTWLVRDEGAASFSTIPGQGEAAFTMPADFRALGQKIQLRLMVSETGAPAPSCTESTPFCQAESPLPDGCYQWITWTVVFE